MYIQVQTKLNQPMTIYDSDQPVSASTGDPLSDKLKKWLQPTVQVKLNDGQILYKSGDFYKPWPVVQYLTIGSIVLGLLGVGLIKLIRR